LVFKFFACFAAAFWSLGLRLFCCCFLVFGSFACFAAAFWSLGLLLALLVLSGLVLGNSACYVGQGCFGGNVAHFLLSLFLLFSVLLKGSFSLLHRIQYVFFNLTGMATCLCFFSLAGAFPSNSLTAARSSDFTFFLTLFHVACLLIGEFCRCTVLVLWTAEMYYLIHVLYSSFEGNEFSLMGVC
jgi:hypothetical protein